MTRIEETIVEIDPNQLDLERSAPKPKTMKWAYAPNGYIQYDPISFEIHPTGSYFPIRLPDKRFAKNQPHVSTCSEPKPGNMGCGVWNGCKFREFAEKMRASLQAPWVGIMVNEEGANDAFNCYEIYTGVWKKKYTNPDARLLRGWKFITDRTWVYRSVGRITVNPHTGERGATPETVREQVKNLGPMYAHLTGERWPFTMRAPKPQVRHVPEPEEEVIYEEADDDETSEAAGEGYGGGGLPGEAPGGGPPAGRDVQGPPRGPVRVARHRKGHAGAQGSDGTERRATSRKGSAARKQVRAASNHRQVRKRPRSQRG